MPHKIRIEGTFMAQDGLDPRDQQILVELQKNGRVSNVELANKVGLSPSACLRRVQALEQRRFIAGYAARLDPKRLGLSVTAFVSVQIAQDQEESTDSFRAAVRDMPHVVECFAVTGTYDFLLRVVAPDLETYENNTVKPLLRISAVRDVRTNFVLDPVKETGSLPLDL